MRYKRLLCLLCVLALLPLCALAQTGAAVIPLPQTHAVILHDNGVTWLLGGADAEAVASALVEIDFYGVDYVVEVCRHSGAAADLAALYHARLIAYQQGELPQGARWEGTRFVIEAAGTTYVFGAEAAEAGRVCVACDGTLLSAAPAASGKTYMLNLNTKKFHRLGCSSIGQMKDKNKKTYIGDWQDIVDMRFAPCKRCKPTE